VQARVGDYAIFFRRAAVEITFEGDKFLVVPQAAILALVRGKLSPEDEVEGYTAP
jgi:co-chaperonin GroES (HSP10)